MQTQRINYLLKTFNFKKLNYPIVFQKGNRQQLNKHFSTGTVVTFISTQRIFKTLVPNFSVKYSTSLPYQYTIKTNHNPYLLSISTNIENEWISKVPLWKQILRFIKLTILFTPAIITLPLIYVAPRIFLEKVWWKLFLKSLETGGVCWIKLGQWMSTRPDLFPISLCKELSKLHSNCPSHSFKETKKLVESAFGNSIEDIFLEFSKEPIASGAVAQVHKGTMKNGEVVAVKVLHPSAKRNVTIDLAIMCTVGAWLAKWNHFKYMGIQEGVNDFSKVMSKQVDLRIEAENLTQFEKNFKGRESSAIFPKLIGKYYSENVLIESFENGDPMGKYLTKKYDCNQKLANLGLESFLQMMIVDNFVHSDLHAGNILVQFVDKKPRLVLLDVGLVTKLSEKDKNNFIELFRAIVNHDGKLGAKLMLEGATQSQISEDQIDLYTTEMGILFDSLSKGSLSNIEIGTVLTNVLEVSRRYKVAIEGNFASLVVATILLEGIGRQLDPSLNLIEKVKPFLKFV